MTCVTYSAFRRTQGFCALRHIVNGGRVFGLDYVELRVARPGRGLLLRLNIDACFSPWRDTGMPDIPGHDRE